MTLTGLDVKQNGIKEIKEINTRTDKRDLSTRKAMSC